MGENLLFPGNSVDIERFFDFWGYWTTGTVKGGISGVMSMSAPEPGYDKQLQIHIYCKVN
jgi:hypothetical protein